MAVRAVTFVNHGHVDPRLSQELGLVVPSHPRRCDDTDCGGSEGTCWTQRCGRCLEGGHLSTRVLRAGQSSQRFGSLGVGIRRMEALWCACRHCEESDWILVGGLASRGCRIGGLVYSLSGFAKGVLRLNAGSESRASGREGLGSFPRSPRMSPQRTQRHLVSILRACVSLRSGGAGHPEDRPPAHGLAEVPRVWRPDGRALSARVVRKAFPIPEQ